MTTENGAQSTDVTPPANAQGTPPNTPPADATKEGGAGDVAAQLANAQKELEAMKARAAALEKEKQEKEEQERLKNLTAEEKAKDLEAKLKAAERTAMIQNARIKHNFTDAIFDAAPINGDTEAEILDSLTNYKKALDAYTEKQKQPPPSAGGTGQPPGATQTTKAAKRAPIAQRFGFVKAV